jgi:hypothetical protein
MEDLVTGCISKGVCVFSAVISLALFIFGCYQLFYLGFSNIAGNEDIRRRWNGNSKNIDKVNIYNEKTTCFTKIR